MKLARRMDRGEALRLILALYVVAYIYHVTEAWGGHTEALPIVKEKGLCDSSDSKACRYLRVEECTGLQAPPPLLARTEAAPCPNGDPAGCLPNGFGGWYHPDHGGMAILPMGNSRWLEHEFVHHVRCWNFGDCSSHDGPEWACE